MKKLFLVSFLALAFFACDKDDDDKTEPEKKTTTTTSHNTELILTADTSIQQVYYYDSERNFKAEFMLDPSMRKWSKKLNFAVGDTIEFGGSVTANTKNSDTEVIYSGSGQLDTLSDNTGFGSSYFQAVIIP